MNQGLTGAGSKAAQIMVEPSRAARTPTLTLPLQSVAVTRMRSTSRWSNHAGVGAAFADPCAGLETVEAEIACRDALDPFILY
jgi:hypothetical protein